MTGSPVVREDSNGGGGLANLALHTLASLAVMRDQSDASSSSRAGSPHSATMATSGPDKEDGNAAPSQSRKPAKKRAVDASYWSNITTADINAPKLPTVAPAALAKPPPRGRRQTIETSKPSSSSLKKRPKTKNVSSSKPNKKRGNSTFKMKANQPSFPVILMAIMSAPQNKEYITFMSNDASFVIIHPMALASNVLPIHFEGNVPTFDQFLHLLAIWGFEVVQDPQYPSVKVYKHPQFRKGDWEACLQIKMPSPFDSPVDGSVKTASVGRGEGSKITSGNNNAALPYVPPEAASNRPRRVTTEVESMAAVPQVSNLGPKFVSTKEIKHGRIAQLAQYSRLLQEKMGGGGGGRSLYLQDQTALLLQQQQQQHQQQTRGRMGMGGMPMNRRRATVDMMPMNMMTSGMLSSSNLGRTRRMPLSHSFQQQMQGKGGMGMNGSATAAAPSDAEVRSATKDIVSAAMNALRPNKESVQEPVQTDANPRPRKCRRHTIDAPPSAIGQAGASSRLDAMTDLFLERSLARLKSRPAGIMGPSATTRVPMQQQPTMTSVGAERRASHRVSLLGS